MDRRASIDAGIFLDRILVLDRDDEGGSVILLRPEDSAEIGNPRLRQVFAYWLAQRPPGRLMPMRGDIDILEIASGLGHYSLLDIAEDPFAARFRVHGTLWADAFGYDLTGMSLTLKDDPVSRHFVTPIAEAVRQKRPVFHMLRFHLTGGDGFVERLVLPLGPDDRQVTQIFCCMFPMNNGR